MNSKRLFKLEIFVASAAFPTTRGFVARRRVPKRLHEHLLMPGHVIFQIVFTVELFPALSAGGLFSPMNFLHVNSQARVRLERLVALLAFSFLDDAVIHAKVFGHVTLDREHEGALAALEGSVTGKRMKFGVNFQFVVLIEKSLAGDASKLLVVVFTRCAFNRLLSLQCRIVDMTMEKMHFDSAVVFVLVGTQEATVFSFPIPFELRPL